MTSATPKKNTLVPLALLGVTVALCVLAFYTYQLRTELAALQEHQPQQRAAELERKDSSRGDFKVWDPFAVDDAVAGEWDPFREMQKMREEMNEVFARSFSRLPQAETLFDEFDQSRFSPTVDIEERDTEYRIHVDLPGAEESNIELDIQDNILGITAQTKRESREEEDGAFVHRERFLGSFHRSIPLPADADIEQMTQIYEDGVLVVRIPKQSS